MAKTKEFPARFLILGATSAIAMAVCARLADRGTRFFLVARNAARLDAVRNDLLIRGAPSVDTYIADLDDTALHPDLLAAAHKSLGGIDAALIAHGVLGDQQQAQRSYAAAEAILRTNFLSAVSLITWLANYFEERRHGTLAVISSVAGDRGRKSNYVYGSSKGALNTFLDGVRNRIDRAGVHVLTIRPGFVDTPMTAHLASKPLIVSPATAARGVLKAIENRKDIAYVPGFWALIMGVVRCVPQSIFKRLNF
jgi:short-subunit dehydrogenase